MNANEAWDRVSANTLISSKEVCRHAPIFEGECHLPVVVKFVRADGVKEIEILKKLTHRNVIRLIESGLPQNGIPDHHYLALERCHDKNLGQLVGSHRENNYPFDLRYWWDIMEQIIYGVEYIHGMKIIHKDLKPENILLTPDEQTIKIADFGISEELKAVDETKSSIGEFGTAGYRPPESFESGTISLKSDIFSLGVVICFTLSYGGNPFGDDDMTQDYNIKKGIVIFPTLFVQNNETTEHLIRCMIRSELDDRPTIGQVLEHPCWTGREEKCDIDYRCPRKPKAPKANIRKKPMKFKVGRDEMLYEMKQRNWCSVPGATQGISQLEEDFPLQSSEDRTTHDRTEAVAVSAGDVVIRNSKVHVVSIASEEHSPQRHIRINRLDLDAEPKLEMVETELRASWRKVDDPNATYFIDLLCNGRKESSEPYQTSECEIEFFDLKPRHKYQCYVWARNSSGDEGNKKWSNSIRYHPDSISRPKPKDVKSWSRNPIVIYDDHRTIMAQHYAEHEGSIHSTQTNTRNRQEGATKAISQLEEDFRLQSSDDRTTHDYKEAVGVSAGPVVIHDSVLNVVSGDDVRDVTSVEPRQPGVNLSKNNLELKSSEGPDTGQEPQDYKVAVGISARSVVFRNAVVNVVSGDKNKPS